MGPIDPRAVSLREVELEMVESLTELELKVGKGEVVSGWALHVGNEGFLWEDGR